MARALCGRKLSHSWWYKNPGQVRGWSILSAETSRLEAIFELGRDDVDVVRRLIHTQEDVPGRRSIANHGVWIKRAGGESRVGRRRASQHPHRAAVHQSATGRTDTAHVRRHGGRLVVFVVELLVTVLQLRHEVRCELVFEDNREFVNPSGCVRVGHSCRGPNQDELVGIACRKPGRIAQESRTYLAFACRQRVVRRQVGFRR